MSEWNVYLVFVDAKSRKYWRARTEDTELVINYGRMGTDGQTRKKSYANAQKALAEMEKTANAKRRKGYVDEGSAVEGGGVDEGVAVAEGPQSADFSLAGDRKVDLRMVCDGKTVRTVVVETYDTAAAAAAAFFRLKEAVGDEGYEAVKDRKDL